MKQLVISLLLICSAESATLKMEILAGELNIYEGYQPVADVTEFVTNTTDNTEFSSTEMIANETVSGTSKDAFAEPPVGYIQWLYGGTASVLPTQDKINYIYISAPIVDGTNSIYQTDIKILRSVVVDGTGTSIDEKVLPFSSLTYARPNFKLRIGTLLDGETAQVRYSALGGGTWRINLAAVTLGFVITNSSFPPEVGYTNGITVSYNSLWIDSGEFATNTYSDLIANPQGTNAVYLRFDSSSNILEIITYPEVLSGSDHTQALNYISSAFLPNMDTNGVPSVDLSGFDAFSPSVADGSIHSRSPAIAEWTRQANTNDTIALTAEDL